MSSVCDVDHYTQLVFLTDMDRPSNNYSDPPNTSHRRPSTIVDLGGGEDETQVYNSLQLVSTGGIEVTDTQKVHVPDDRNGTSEHYLLEAFVNNNRELWCTWGSWAGGSPGPVNSTAGEGARQGELIRMDLTPTSMQEQAHRIKVLHEGTNLSILAAAPYDLQ